MSGNNRDFKVKNGIQPTSYFEGVGTVTSGSEGYSIAAASYDSVSFSVSAQEITGQCFAFNSDGTKMFITGSTGDDVNEYALSTAWDISTASYTQVFSLSAQETTPRGMAFNNDGTKMYIIGNQDAVLQYSLSTGFDLSTASYDSVSFSVSSQDSVPESVCFNNDGTKMYVAGTSNDAAFQYTLSTAFDVSTASYDSVSFDLSGQTTYPRDLIFNADGTKMFMVSSGDDAYEYSLSTAFDISTASYTGVNFDFTPQDTNPASIFFKSDGTKMFMLGNTGDAVYQYSTVITTKTLDLSTGSVFEVTPTSDIQVTLSNPADSGTVSGATLLLSGEVTSAYDLSALSYDSKSFSTTSQSSDPYALEVKPDGTAFYVLDITNGNVYQYVVSSPTDITTATYASKSLSVGSQDTSPRDIAFKADGTSLYMVGATNDRVYQYNLSTAWDISTASYGGFKSIATEDGFPAGIRLSQDGTKMILLGGSNILYQYTLSTAWSVSTASYDSVSFSVATQAGNAEAMTFKPDGTEFYIGDWGDDAVYKYNLSTPWDLSTASYSGPSGSLSAGAGTTKLISLQFLNSGESLYILDGDVDTIYQYSTATPATITYDTAIEWPSGTAPTSPAIGETDILAFSTSDGGTSYKGVLAIDGAK